MKLSRMSIKSNCCICGFISGNVWNSFLFQIPMSTMAQEAGPITPISIYHLRNTIQRFHFCISMPPHCNQLSHCNEMQLNEYSTQHLFVIVHDYSNLSSRTIGSYIIIKIHCHTISSHSHTNEQNSIYMQIVQL